MIDIFDDELDQMDENESRFDPDVSSAIQLKDPIRTLAKKCIVLSEDASLDKALKTFKKYSTSCVILTKDKKIAGIFTLISFQNPLPFIIFINFGNFS